MPSSSRFNETFGSKEALRREATEMKRVIEELNSPLVFSHNDTLSGNIIFNNKASKQNTLVWYNKRISTTKEHYYFRSSIV